MKPNHAMERTADRCAFTFQMTSTHSPRATRGSVRRSSFLFSLGDEETGGTRQRVIDKTARLLQLLTIFEGWTIASGFASFRAF